MSRCVERVEERLKLLPQILQLKLLSCKRQHSVSVEKPGSIRFKCRNAVKAKSERKRKCHLWPLRRGCGSKAGLGDVCTGLFPAWRPIPASEPLCADPSSLRVRRFFRISHTQTAACRCATAARELPAREAWRTPLENTWMIPNQTQNEGKTIEKMLKKRKGKLNKIKN